MTSLPPYPGLFGPEAGDSTLGPPSRQLPDQASDTAKKNSFGQQGARAQAAAHERGRRHFESGYYDPTPKPLYE